MELPEETIKRKLKNGEIDEETAIKQLQVLVNSLSPTKVKEE